jgi:hypothetical protein
MTIEKSYTVVVHGIEMTLLFCIGYFTEIVTLDNGREVDELTGWTVLEVNQIPFSSGPDKWAWENLLDQEQVAEDIAKDMGH